MLAIDNVNVETLVQDVVATVTPAAANNGNTISLDVASQLGMAQTDGFKLSQCLLNLMANASKFTRDGQVKLCVRREMIDGAPWFAFDVIDTGIGIAPEAQARLFQPFEQADGSTTRKHGGTGLGLATSRRLVELMGGQIGVDSRPGQGSTFWFSVALRRGTAMPEAGTLAPGLEGRRVLAVDDQAIVRQVIAGILRRHGTRVEEAVNGEAALARMRSTYQLRRMTPWD